MHENEISYLVRGCIFKVYKTLGPGLLESAYEAALSYEIDKIGLKVRRQLTVPMEYESIVIDMGYKIDLLVEEKVIIEIKSVKQFHGVHYLQLLTYLKLADLRLGLLVNFNCTDISKSIVRKVNGLDDNY